MRKIVFLSMITIFLFSFKESEGFKWYSLTVGLELARRDIKPMLIFIYTSWCD